MFTASRRFLIFDYLRVPYECVTDLRKLPVPDAREMTWAQLWPSAKGEGPSLIWPVFGSSGDHAGPPCVRFRVADLILHARLVADAFLERALTDSPDRWSRAEVLRADDGTVLGSVWRSASGGIVLPFDPDEVLSRFWSERYLDTPGTGSRGHARRMLLAAYYALRPLMPRALQITLRRAASHVQRRRSFPRWPVEESLHGFLDLVLEQASSLAGSAVPWIAPWPAGFDWALVLTHDVETEFGMHRIPVLRDIDERAGHRSSWNLVPGRYVVPDSLVAELSGRGLEVGVHGLRHDGRDLDPRELPHRMPEIRRWAERWEAAGFRSPATHRDWAVMSALPFQYDSSSPDSDPFEPQSGGCCSWLPFFNGPIVELPITMPQDHTLFVILGVRDGRSWIDKAEHIRSRGGMALLITHPDYVDAPSMVAAYEQLLAHFASDPGVWRPLPSEVAAWWRRRAASSLERAGSGWRVVGPAAGRAAVRFGSGSADESRWPADRHTFATQDAAEAKAQR